MTPHRSFRRVPSSEAPQFASGVTPAEDPATMSESTVAPVKTYGTANWGVPSALRHANQGEAQFAVMLVSIGERITVDFWLL